MIGAELQSPAARLDDFLADESERYGLVPEIHWDDQTNTVTGWVVTARQRERLGELIGGGVEVGVLEDPTNDQATVHWARVASRTPVFNSPFSKKLATEILPTDPPVRVLNFPETAGLRLVQTACRTLGWVFTQCLEPAPKASAKREFLSPRRALPGVSLSIEATQLAGLLDDARSWAEKGVRYKLGGRDESRHLDCSAFCQRLFEIHCNLLLPRNSKAQRRCGRRVGRRDIAAGDLIFASAKTRNISHVALAVTPKDWAHACLSLGRVVLEHQDTFLTRYRFRGARRIGELA